ncbi:site-specific integrase [Parasphingorhabdus sp.]|uniref:site-specific integrase n=1 Tax=Parasphingorhabdus sp. TaxID=2709688 RepID=UPI000C11DED4|nr:MAG: integrase [Sphingopyxis sp.]
MESHRVLNGKVQLYRRGESRIWQCSASVGGKQRRATTKRESLALASEFAEDWYLALRGKDHAGILLSEKSFAQAAAQFLAEYEVITEGERSQKWTEGHEIRLRIHLLPFFGELGVSKVTPAKVQDYRVHRMTSRLEPNPASRSNRPLVDKPPARSTLHNEIVTLRMVLKTAIRNGWLEHLPDLSPPYRTQGKIVHRPWFSPAEYKQLYEATRAYARDPFHERDRWNAEQVHDYVLFLANTGLRPDEAKNLQHRDVAIVEDEATGETLLEIEVRGKRGVGYCKSMPSAVRPYERLLNRPKPVQAESRREKQRRRKEGLPPLSEDPPAPEYPELRDPVFPGNHVRLFNGILERANLKRDRDEKPRTAYSLRHTYICMRLMEGADIYQIAKNCRTSVEMIEKFYAAHIKSTLDAASINVRRPKPLRASKSSPRAEVDLDDE